MSLKLGLSPHGSSSYRFTSLSEALCSVALGHSLAYNLSSPTPVEKSIAITNSFLVV